LGLSYKVVIVLAVACGGLLVLARRQRLKAGLAAWVCTFALGYRTMPVTANYKIHPSEVILWGLFLLALVEMPHAKQRMFRTPAWVWPFACFWPWGFIAAIPENGPWGRMPWDTMFSEFRDFLLLLPLGVVAVAAMARKDSWKWALTALFAVGTWIGATGSLEYFFPGVARMFPAFMASPDPSIAEDGFARASFSFWGGPNATMVVVLCTPIAIVLWQWYGQGWRRALIVAGVAVQVLGIYIGGYRSMWLTMAIEVVLWTLIMRGPLFSIFILVPAAASLQYLSPAAHDRSASLVAILQGQPTDSSGIDRWGLVTNAWQTIWEYPWGVGWAGLGWVHSDFVQITANLGVLAGLLFALAYLNTLLRLARTVLFRVKQREARQLGISLLLSFLAAGGLLLTQGVEVLPQMMLPVWFVWVLAEVWMQRLRYIGGMRKKYVSAPNYRLTTNFQLRQSRPDHAGVHPLGG
jgi:hypothetical protein